MLDYRQKPASVNAFYTPYLASKFPCLLDFAAASSQLCAHVRHKDGCLSVNSAFALTDRKRGPVVSCTSGRKLGKFVHFVKNKQQTNTCVSVTWSLLETQHSGNPFSRSQINFHDSLPKFRAFSRPGTKFSNTGDFAVFPGQWEPCGVWHYNDVIMGTMASQITSLTILYSTVYSGVDRRLHQSSASLVFVQGIHRGPVNSPHKWPVTWIMFPFDDIIMNPAYYLFRQGI